MQENLTEYQRGNRDGLISFAKWAYDMYKLYKEDANSVELKACESRALARENVRRMIINKRQAAECFKKAAEHALRMSESLPHDPEEGQ